MASNRSVAGELIRGLEAIAGNENDSLIGSTSSPFHLSSPASSISKRRRLSIEGGFSENSKASNYRGDVKLLVMMDEIKLENERLQDKLKSVTEENERQKDKFLRQIEFLDEENNRLRKSFAEKTEKYYEDKKKWMASKRELEKEKEKAKKASPSVDTLAPSSSSSSSHASKADNADSLWTESLTKLEHMVQSKSDEVKSLSVKIAELSEQVIYLTMVTCVLTNSN